ncbi:MAG: tetratricopeptide repeat protein [Magnetococcales bacterium]|nr:tetratricopeptide repeat protein [Magnetococcales bacterium]
MNKVDRKRKKKRSNNTSKPNVAFNPVEATKALQHAISLHKAGKIVKAIQSYKKALKLNPTNAKNYSYLGLALQEKGQLLEATNNFQKAIAIKPDYAQAHSNLGIVLQNQGLLKEAIISYKNSITHKPDYAGAYNNLGNALKLQEKTEEAIINYQKAILYEPDYAEYYNNLGDALKDLGKIEEAIAKYLKAISLKTDYAEAYYNLSLAQLLKGDFHNGFANYNWRWKNEQYNTERYLLHAKKLWQGEPLEDRRILVWSEQGLGENIIFSSIIHNFIKSGAKVVLECNARLVKIFERSFPAITIRPHPKQFKTFEYNSEFDFIIPLGNLFGLLCSDISNLQSQPYHLIASNSKKEIYRNRYLKHSNNMLVGIAWHSNSSNYKHKSMALSELRPLLETPGVTFVDLQYGDTFKERSKLISDTGISIIHDEAVDQMGDLDDFGAQVAAMDLVVTISNTTAHMAGALGVPTILMLSKLPIWYWMLESDYSPWYPSMTIFRLKKQGEWGEVIKNVTQAVRDRSADHNQLLTNEH